MRYFPFGLEARLRHIPWVSLAGIALALFSGEYAAAVFLFLYAFPIEERAGKTAFASFLAVAGGIGWSAAQYGESSWSPATAPVDALLAAYLLLFAGENQRFGSLRFPAGLYAFAGILVTLFARTPFANSIGFQFLAGGSLLQLAGFAAGLAGAALVKLTNGLEEGLVYRYEREFLEGATRSRTLSEKLGYCFVWLERNPASRTAARLCARYAYLMLQERGNPQAGNFVAHARAWFTRGGFTRFADDVEFAAAVPVSWLIEGGDERMHKAALEASRKWKDARTGPQKKARWKMLLFLIHETPTQNGNPFLKSFHGLTEEVLTNTEFIDELQSEALAVPEVLAALESYGIWLGLAKSKY